MKRKRLSRVWRAIGGLLFAGITAASFFACGGGGGGGGTLIFATGADANQSTITVSPSTLVADGKSVSTITVVVRDVNGNPLQNELVTLSATGTGNTLTQPAAATGSNGTVSGTIVSTVSGIKTLSASVAPVVSDATITPVTLAQTPSVTFTAVVVPPPPPPPTPGAVSASNSTASASPIFQVANGTATISINVQAIDSTGLPVPNQTVTITATGSNNTVTSGTTNASGSATVTLASTTVESKTVTVTAGGVVLNTKPVVSFGTFTRFAYSVNNTANSVSAFSFAPSTGFLRASGFETATQIFTNNPAGALNAPRFMVVHPNGSFSYVSQGGANTIAAYAMKVGSAAINLGGGLVVGGTGTLGVPGANVGTGVNPNGMAITPNGSFLYVANQGGGTISGYTINQATGALTAIAGSNPSPFPTGTTPVRLAIHPNGKFIYCANAGTNDISVFNINQSTGALVQNGPTIPVGANPQGIVIDPSGAFLYTANNGADTISAFTINGTLGTLTAVAGSPFNNGGANGANALAIDPAGKFLFVSNNTTNGVSAYTITAGTGVLAAVAGSPFASGGTGPVDVQVEPAGAFVYLVNGGTNDISCFSLAAATGVLTLQSTHRTQQGPAMLAFGRDRGAGSVSYTPTFAVVTDTNTNNLFPYSISNTTGALTATPPVSSSGVAPSLVATDPFWKFLYSGNTTSGTITAFTIGVPGGLTSAINPLQPNTPGGANPAPVAPGANMASIAVVASGCFVYSAHGASNTVTGFVVSSGFLGNVSTFTGNLGNVATVAGNFIITGTATNSKPFEGVKVGDTISIPGLFQPPTTFTVTVVDNTAVTNVNGAITVNVAPTVTNTSTPATDTTPATTVIRGTLANPTPFGAVAVGDVINVPGAGPFVYTVTAVNNAPTAGFNTGTLTVSAGATTQSSANGAGSPAWDQSTMGRLGAAVPGAPYVVNDAASLASDPAGRFLYVGRNNVSNNISGFSVTSTTGALTALNGGVPFPLAFGATLPNSIVVHPTGRFFYTANNGSNNVSAFTIGAGGLLTEIAGAAPSPYAAGTAPNSVAVTPNGKFLFTANGGSNNISAFSVDQTATATAGVLTAVAGSPFAVPGVAPAPKTLSIDPAGKFLYVTCPGNNTTVAYSIDATGALTQVASGVPAAPAQSNPQAVVTAGTVQ